MVGKPRADGASYAREAARGPEPQIAVVIPAPPPPRFRLDPPAQPNPRRRIRQASTPPAAEPPVREAPRPVEPVNLPVQAPRDIEIQTTAPGSRAGRSGKTFFRECDMCPVMAVVPGGKQSDRLAQR
jgi:hypothetical protein